MGTRGQGWSWPHVGRQPARSARRCSESRVGPVPPCPVGAPGSCWTPWTPCPRCSMPPAGSPGSEPRCRRGGRSACPVPVSVRSWKAPRDLSADCVPALRARPRVPRRPGAAWSRPPAPGRDSSLWLGLGPPRLVFRGAGRGQGSRADRDAAGGTVGTASPCDQPPPGSAAPTGRGRVGGAHGAGARSSRWPRARAGFLGRMLKYSPLRGVGVVRRCQKSKGQLSAVIP